MEKVTEYFEKYREASRHLRNTYYIPSDSDDWDKSDDFDDVNVMLFQHLVCAPLNINYDQVEWFCSTAPIFQLKPQGVRLPIMINRDPNVSHGNWDHQVNCVEPDDLELTFISYFDWDPQGVVDHRYIMCRIADAKNSKNVIGHTALVESTYVEIYYDNTANK